MARAQKLLRGRDGLDPVPSDLMRPFIASRIDSSSSMIEIIGFAFGTRPPAPGLVIVMMRGDPKPLGAG
jgi:hypothetical protein